MMEPLVDVAVLLIFFIRAAQFREVFEQVKKARPSTLFLYQDGPREDYPEDMDKIMECRAIAENIDWNCKVHKLYQSKNIGCNPSGYIAHTWAFSHVDKCIILEDDVVPSVSFFSFCKELLDKYENDERIVLISGMNLEEKTESDGDYFFSSTTSIWGWASWKRVVSNWDSKHSFLDEPYYKGLVKYLIKDREYPTDFLKSCEAHRNTGKEFFETILISFQYLHSGLTIVPKLNMINNIGVMDESTHFSGSIDTLPRGYRRIFTMPRYELEGPIQHPKFVIEDIGYKDRTYRIKAWGHPCIKMYRFCETLIYKWRFEGINGVMKEINRKFRHRFQ